VNQLERQQEKAQSQYESSYGVYSTMSVDELVEEPQAMKMAQRIFSNNCAVCHGKDGGGYLGFPNLTDEDWLWGGSPAKIKETLINGRQAAMPAWSSILGEKGIADVTQHVLSLSNREQYPERAEIGAAIFAQNCAACHGADGKGMYIVGAPNLTDDIWLYEGTPKGIRTTLRNGRNGVMPSQENRLRPEKIHLLTAYVYSLSMEMEKE
jgi:cytochrome c oxidase cbb3-type subunit 3